MGSPPDEPGRQNEETLHKVTSQKSYFMATTDVTVSQFKEFVTDTGYQTDAEKTGSVWAHSGPVPTWAQVRDINWRNPGFSQGQDHPVVAVSWNDAVTFCDWLSHKEGRHYRLPSEAEWEYACRAGSQSIYPWGNDPDDGRQYANLADNTAIKAYPGLRGERSHGPTDSFSLRPSGHSNQRVGSLRYGRQRMAVV